MRRHRVSRVQPREIVVSNEGETAPSLLAETGSGLGLTGMRERVESAGGSLDVGPDGGGGWRLHARLPVAEPALVLAR